MQLNIAWLLAEAIPMGQADSLSMLKAMPEMISLAVVNCNAASSFSCNAQCAAGDSFAYNA